MHISEGILTTPAGQAVLAAGAVAAAAGTFVGLRRLDEEQIPKAAVLGSAFFVASAIQVPLCAFVRPSGAQRTDGPGARLGRLSGRARGADIADGILLDRRADGARVEYGHHGRAGRGLPLPLSRGPAQQRKRADVYAAGFAAGAVGVMLGALLSTLALLCAGRTFMCWPAAFLALHLPVALVEGLVTGSVVVLLRQVRPEVLRAPLLVPAVQEAADGCTHRTPRGKE